MKKNTLSIILAIGAILAAVAVLIFKMGQQSTITVGHKP